MQILIDISRLFYFKRIGRQFTGIDRVGLEYLRHYAGARAVLTLGPFSSVLSEQDSRLAFRLLLDPSRNGMAAAAWLTGKAYLNWWARPRVDGCVLLNTSHTGLERKGYASGLIRRGARAVCFIHDLIPITHPEHCRPGEGARHKARIRTAVTAGRGIIVQSEHTLAALRRFCAQVRLPLPPAVVAPLATPLRHTEAGSRPMAEPYFVVLGTIEARKNLALLLEVWRKLVRAGGEAAPRLIMIGQRGWKGDPVADSMAGPELQGSILERASCSDREVVNYLQHAQALLFPSFEEGYGLPLAEALTLGVPAIVSDLGIFREVAGDIPEYADPRDQERWLELVSDYARPTSGSRAAQLRRLAGYQPTTWDQHFQMVDDFLRQLQSQE